MDIQNHFDCRVCGHKLCCGNHGPSSKDEGIIICHDCPGGVCVDKQ